MVKRTARTLTLYVLEAIAALLALLIFAAGIALWRLASGPVAIDALRDPVTDLVADAFEAERAEIGDLQLSFEPETAAMVITARNVRAFRPDGSVAVLDFGCVKELPKDFYDNYLQLLRPGMLDNEAAFRQSCLDARIILPDDKPEEQKFYMDIFREAMELVGRPFFHDRFAFDDTYFDEIYAYGDRMSKMPELRKIKTPRGAKDGIYLNRTYFGLFSILNKLEAEVATRRFIPELEPLS